MPEMKTDSASVEHGQNVSTPVTPDGRYFVVRGRLWRATNPQLGKEERELLVKRLMEARRAKGVAMRAKDQDARERARQAVDEAKRQLGERGEVWWADGSADFNRHLVKNTPYAHWYAALTESR